MHVSDAAPARQQRPQIAPRLRAVQLAERPTHFRNAHIRLRLGRDDQEQTGVGPALMQLAGGVEIARADTECGRAPHGTTPGGAYLLELSHYFGRGRDIGEDGEIVVRAVRGAKLCQGERWEGRSMFCPSGAQLRTRE